MSTISHSPETSSEAPLSNAAEAEHLHAIDQQLFTELYKRNTQPRRYPSAVEGTQFSNKQLAAMVKNNYSKTALAEIEAFLEARGALHIPTIGGFTALIDSFPQPITIVAATEINDTTPNHGEMVSMLYLRDHIQTARALMELYLQDSEQYKKEGKRGLVLLKSALHLLSTPAQLKRFDDVIRRGSEASQEDWPHISLWFDDIEGNRPNGWRNTQDTFQMLAHLTFDAIDRGFLDVDELAEAHKKFLGSVVPLLESVGFPLYENSGSWEEVSAHRTSVMAIEIALLYKIKTLLEKDNTLDFLADHYDISTTSTSGSVDRSFSDTLDELLNAGLCEIGRRLPSESAEYNPQSPKFREADAALTYILIYNLPELLAKNTIAIGPENEQMSRFTIECLIIEQLASLDDPETGGMFRYKDDSYQRVNFHTNEVRSIVNAIKHKVNEDAMRDNRAVDLDHKQVLRGSLTPIGRPAAWTHPLGQLSAWAAERSLNEHDEVANRYRILSAHFLNRALSMVTGDNQWHAVLGTDNQYHVQRVPAFRLPECLITYQRSADETPLIVPSPHTPLNWSSVMLKLALGLLRTSTPN